MDISTPGSLVYKSDKPLDEVLTFQVHESDGSITDAPDLCETFLYVASRGFSLPFEAVSTFEAVGEVDFVDLTVADGLVFELDGVPLPCEDVVRAWSAGLVELVTEAAAASTPDADAPDANTPVD